MYPLVTIGIPTYNRANSYLRQALESSLKQTYPNIEIVVSDNCSTDDTEDIVKGFNDPRIRYFKQKENIGAYKNFNFCLQQAVGTYFLIHSDDDLVDNDFIDVCMKAADYSTDIGVIRTGTRVIDSQGVVVNESLNKVAGFSFVEFIRGWFTHETACYPCSTLFNTIKLKEIGGFGPENNLFHDCFVTFKLAAKFGRVDVEDIKASFRKHSDEITFSVKIKDWSEDALQLLDMLCNLVSIKDRETVRNEGLKFFSDIIYGFASKIQTPVSRAAAYVKIYNYFNYASSPPPMRNIMSRTPVRRLMRIFNSGTS